MKKIIIMLTILALLITSIFTFNLINEYQKNKDTKKLEDQINTINKEIDEIELKIKNSKTKDIIEDEEELEVLEVWKKELKKLENLYY